jgi:hypothetical protein
MDIFYARHHSIEFCSFFHKPSLDLESMSRHAPHLAHAVVALSALYMTRDVALDQGCPSTIALSELHAKIAREYARQSADEAAGESISLYYTILAMTHRFPTLGPFVLRPD